MTTSHVEALVKILWDYHHMHHTLKKADVIIGTGSHDIRVADRVTELFLSGLAPLVVMTGGFGRITRKLWQKTEAELFAERAQEAGVPHDKILLEKNSTNTGENIAFTRILLEEHGIRPNHIILVCQPYMERRVYATCKKVWQEPEALITSPDIAFDQYKTTAVSRDEMISIIVGDLQRIRIYSEKGFQIYQEIPQNVWEAFEKLVALGYTSHLIKN